MKHPSRCHNNGDDTPFSSDRFFRFQGFSGLFSVGGRGKFGKDFFLNCPCDYDDG